MLVICEDCAKKYNIDESKIRGNRARFTCNECGHIIIVNKSDLKRPLVHSAGNRQSPSSSIDLLKEMEKPLAEEESSPFAETSTQGKEEAASPSDTASKKEKSISIPVYFLIGGGVAFVVTTCGIGYILSLHNGQTPLAMASLVLLVTWAISFGVLFGIGTYLAKSVNNLTEVVKRLNQGENNVTINAKGPRELSALAKALSELSNKRR